MYKEKVLKATEPVLKNETIFEINKIKSFIDVSLKELTVKKFETDGERIVYLVNSLSQIKDYIVTQVVENSVRRSLILEFQKIEKEIELGNDTDNQEKKSNQSLDDLLASDPSN